MTLPLHQDHTRPFNAEHARAGAPCRYNNGDQVQILMWDRPDTECIVAISRADSEVRTHLADGSNRFNSPNWLLVMTPLGFIDGKPVFVGDELEMTGHAGWSAFVAHPSNRDFTCCRWPLPAPVYPVTRMIAPEIADAYDKTRSAFGEIDRLEQFANAVLRHAIDAGQVVTTAEANENELEHYNRGIATGKDQTGPTKEAYDQCSRDLGKAERLLEALGYRLAGDGVWTLEADQGTLARNMAMQQVVRDSMLMADKILAEAALGTAR